VGALVGSAGSPGDACVAIDAVRKTPKTIAATVILVIDAIWAASAGICRH
jgi:hypothetical protein